jgi:hypothetical protein
MASTFQGGTSRSDSYEVKHLITGTPSSRATANSRAVHTMSFGG